MEGFFDLKITIETPIRINSTPRIIVGVKCSPKNTIPQNNAVMGSRAPKIAVVVEPISFIAIIVVSKETMVGKIANASAKNNIIGPSNI